MRILRTIARMNVGGPAMLILALLKSDRRELLDQKLVYGGVAKGEREVPLHGVEKKVSYNRSLGREISIRDLFCLLRRAHKETLRQRQSLWVPPSGVTCVSY
jgi:hypothetical protein